MRFLHLSDLHFGKTIYGASLLERGDQPYWVDRYLALADDIRPDAVVIAGDVYDRSAPSGDAVDLLSRMLSALAGQGIPVLMVAGNHDSGQRLSFACDLLARQDLHIAGRLTPRLPRMTLPDEYGEVTFWGMPYVFPALVAETLGQEDIRDYDTAVRRLLAAQEMDTSRRNVLVAHQNVTQGGVEGLRGGSETMVGGVGQVDYTAFNGFDYVALGHIHAAYAVGRDAVRYAGSPLCYHFDELRQPEKGPLLVELGPKGTAPKITPCLLPPLHPMREFRGPLRELQDRLTARPDRGEYGKVVLTDTALTPEIIAFFRSLFEARDSVLLELQSEYRLFSSPTDPPETAAVEDRPLEELFSDFYAARSGGAAPSPGERTLLEAAGELLRRSGDMTPEDAAERLVAFALEQEEDR